MESNGVVKCALDYRRMNINAVDMIKKYQKQLDVMFQQPHTEEDAEWITAEHLWAEKLLERIYLN